MDEHQGKIPLISLFNQWSSCTKGIMDAASFLCKHELETQCGYLPLTWSRQHLGVSFMSILHQRTIINYYQTVISFCWRTNQIFCKRGKHSICFTKCEAFFSASFLP